MRPTVRPYYVPLTDVSRPGIHLLIRRRSIPHGWTARGWRRCLRRRGAIHKARSAQERTR